MQTCINQEVEEMEYFLSCPTILRYSQLYPYQLYLQRINHFQSIFHSLLLNYSTSQEKSISIKREIHVYKTYYYKLPHKLWQ